MMQLFAIKRNLLRIDMRKGCLHPGDKTALNGFRIDPCQHAIKGIMRWNTSRKCQKRLKPFSFLVRHNSNFREVIRDTALFTVADVEDLNQEGGAITAA